MKQLTARELYKAAWRVQRTHQKGYLSRKEFETRNENLSNKAVFAAAKSFVARQGN